MRIETLQALSEALKADLYCCLNTVTGASIATHQIADARHFLTHCGGTGYVETYVRQRPPADGVEYDPLCDVHDVDFLKQYADAIIAGLTRRRASVPLTLAQEAELKVAQVALKALLREQTMPVKTDPKRPSTWPVFEDAVEAIPPFVADWSQSERRDCSLCGAEGVATLHDPDGVLRCEHCFEDLEPCVRCGTVSTRPDGAHYCHVKDPK